jgi:hypothetical protein
MYDTTAETASIASSSADQQSVIQSLFAYLVTKVVIIQITADDRAAIVHSLNSLPPVGAPPPNVPKRRRALDPTANTENDKAQLVMEDMSDV